MELTWEEIKSIANRLHEVVSDNFHDAIFNNLSKDSENYWLTVDYGFEVSDEDIEKIKEQLKRIL